MRTEELVNYWVETSAHDHVTMQHLYTSGDYAWCLFIGHLVIEKLLKACYVKSKGKQAPRTHNLVRLTELAKMEVDAPTKATLTRLMQFQVDSHPEIKREFYRRATRGFAAEQLEAIEEIREWLLKTLSE